MTMVVASCVICPSVPAPVRAASRPAGSFPPIRPSAHPPAAGAAALFSSQVGVVQLCAPVSYPRGLLRLERLMFFLVCVPLQPLPNW